MMGAFLRETLPAASRHSTRKACAPSGAATCVSPDVIWPFQVAVCSASLASRQSVSRRSTLPAPSTMDTRVAARSAAR